MSAMNVVFDRHLAMTVSTNKYGANYFAVNCSNFLLAGEKNVYLGHELSQLPTRVRCMCVSVHLQIFAT
jgi:hypothetical protein